MMGEVGLSATFLRDFVEAVRRRQPAAVTRALLRLPKEMRLHLDGSALRLARPSDTVPLDAGEELLLAIDAAASGGNGQVIENAGFDIVTRELIRGTASGFLGEFYSTMTRQRGQLERVFPGMPLRFEIDRTPAGFTLTLGVPGRPRATKILSHLATGVARAIHQLARASEGETLRVLNEVLDDRSVLAVWTQHSAVPEPPGADASKASRSSRFRTSNLTAEVDRIMNGAGRAQPPPSNREPTSLRPTKGPSKPDEAEPTPARPTGTRPQQPRITAVKIASSDPYERLLTSTAPPHKRNR